MTDSVISESIFVTGTADPGFTFAADNDTLTIDANTLVGSALADGVYSVHDNNLLTNFGSIVSGAGDGVGFDGATGTIVNNLGGTITGLYEGIHCINGNKIVTNHGEVTGLDGAGISMDESVHSFTVDNDGKVHGYFAGVLEQGGPGPGSINNTGTGLISSDNYGIDVFGMPVSIYNGASATISGAVYAIWTHDFGAISLTNLGEISGSVECTVLDANDTVVNHGHIAGNVDLGSGNDAFVAAGLGSVTGVVHGGDGDDRLVAGRARDVFAGDAGGDTFVFNGVAMSPATAQHDVILDFKSLQGDKIDVHAIDADVLDAGHQHFVFIGGDTFAHYHALHPGVVGMLRYSAASHQLQGNVNGDFAHADFLVALPGVAAINPGDLILV